MKAILKSYARNISTLATKKTLMKDVRTEHKDIYAPSYNSYINALERLYVIQDIPAWSPNIRSANTLRKSHKKEFIDSSIAVASLNLAPEKLLKDFETFGFIFENISYVTFWFTQVQSTEKYYIIMTIAVLSRSYFNSNAVDKK